MLGSRTIFSLWVALSSAWGLTVSADTLSSSVLKDAASPPEAEPRRWSGEWNLELGGGDYTEGKDEGVLTYFYLRSKFDYRFNTWMHALVSPRLDLYASRVQQRNEEGDAAGSSTRIRFSDAYLSVQPLEALEFRAGAIGQYYLSSAMLVSGRRAFPGAEELVTAQLGPVRAQLIAQQVVPTSNTLNTERTEKESLPMFQTQSLSLKSGYEDWLEGGAFGGHFEWRELPSKVAFESALLGNNVVGEVAPGSRFLYDFNGYFWGAEILVGPKAWAHLIIQYEGINNVRAPSNAGRGEMWGIGPHINFGDVALELRYRRYFVESDATVASYNFYRLGNTNRIGDNFELKLDFRKQKFSIVGDWYNARTINNNPNQFTMNAIYLGVETHYAPF